MKLKGDYQIKEISGQPVAIYCHGDTADLRQAISLSGCAKTIFEALLIGSDKEGLIQLLIQNYNISQQEAKKDVEDLLAFLQNNNLLDGQL